MYNIILCDDDSEYIKYLKGIISKTSIQAEEITYLEYTSGTEMLEELKRRMKKGFICNLLILDMQTEEGVDGNDVAKQFRELYPESLLVLCSGVFSPTDESFKSYPFRYLIKNYTEKRMLKEVQSIIKEMEDQTLIPYISAKIESQLIKIKASDILYFQNYKHGSVIYTKENPRTTDDESEINPLTSQKLEHLYKQLSIYGFEYSHNSYLVNMDYVKSIHSAGYLELTNGETVKISRARMKYFKEAFAKRMGS